MIRVKQPLLCVTALLLPAAMACVFALASWASSTEPVPTGTPVKFWCEVAQGLPGDGEHDFVIITSDAIGELTGFPFGAIHEATVAGPDSTGARRMTVVEQSGPVLSAGTRIGSLTYDLDVIEDGVLVWVRYSGVTE